MSAIIELFQYGFFQKAFLAASRPLLSPLPIPVPMIERPLFCITVKALKRAQMSRASLFAPFQE